ncbi:hypothetical protein LXL04_010278 [Taraxacum kok-saghyz]
MSHNNQHILGLATNSSFQIPPLNIKLDSSNLCLWRTTIISALETFDLESFVLDPQPPSETITVANGSAAPTISPNPAYQLWKKRDRYVLLWLKSTLTERALAIVARSTTSQLAWQSIEKTFQAQTRASRMAMKTQLQTLSKENQNSISTEDLIGHILYGLDSSYGPFTAAVMMKDDLKSVDDLVAPVALTVNRSQRSNFPNSGTSSANSAANQSGAPRRQRPHCQLCTKPGHEAVDCWQRSNLVDYPARKPNPRHQPPRQANTAQYSGHSTVGDPSWYLDSGATDHLAPDLAKMNIAEEYHGNDPVQVGNGTKLPISHIASTFIHSLKLPSVLIVPHITKRLISASKLSKDNNVYLELWPNCCVIKTLQGKVLLKGDVRDGLYRLHAILNKNHNKASPGVALVGVRTSLQGWHRRLAHPHVPLLRRLVSTFDLPVSSHALPSSHRFPLAISHVTSSKPFDLLYSDVWGPAPSFSMNGNRYFLLFIDDHSKFVWIYFLSHKSQVFPTFVQFHKMIKNQFSSDIKQIQSDWGGEYRNFTTYLNDHGIGHRVSCPYTQEQNDAVERRNRVIVEKGLSLLAHSSLPDLFWEHAFKTATYLHNRTITPTLDFQSPYQKLYHATPDYALLKTFGCLCFPFLRPYNSHKLDFRSKPCVFIGYSPTHKGYLCYHQPTSRLYISRHVVFNEDVFPYQSNPTPLPSSPTPHSTPSPMHLLHQISIPSSLSPPSTPPSPPTQPSSTSSNTSSNSSPHYQRSTISSRAHQSSPHGSHYRPSTTSRHPMVTQAQTNSLKPKTFTSTLTSNSATEPTTFKHANQSSCWQEAMKTEYDALLKNNTSNLVPCPTNVNIVGCKWIYRIKRKSDGSIDRYKARLVAQGYSQEEGVDYFETFSPVIKPTTIRLVLLIAISKGWSIRQLDINNAFLNGDLQENIYMRQPKGFEDPLNPSHVCHLRKAIYGLKQAPRAWFNKLKFYLIQQQFRPCHSDNSLFRQRPEFESAPKSKPTPNLPHPVSRKGVLQAFERATTTIYALVYVDDVIITGTNAVLIQNFINQLNKVFSLKDLGDLHFFLGIQITRKDTVTTRPIQARHRKV